VESSAPDSAALFLRFNFASAQRPGLSMAASELSTSPPTARHAALRMALMVVGAVLLYGAPGPPLRTARTAPLSRSVPASPWAWGRIAVARSLRRRSRRPSRAIDGGGEEMIPSGPTLGSDEPVRAPWSIVSGTLRSCNLHRSRREQSAPRGSDAIPSTLSGGRVDHRAARFTSLRDRRHARRTSYRDEGARGARDFRPRSSRSCLSARRP
jgi:hypothetical protein